jgi:hypothetical protein
MAYADFTAEEAAERLGVYNVPGSLFPAVTPAPVPQWLTDRLARNNVLAFLNEKSRSERIVTPVLTAVEELLGPDECAVYSGYRLDIDREAGLMGECDFLIALAPPVPPLRPPIATVVEAKRGDIDLSYGQCIAQMVGSARFNARHGLPDRPMYGCITNGVEWLFLRLSGTVVTIDTRRHLWSDLGSILGVFQLIASEFQPTR